MTDKPASLLQGAVQKDQPDAPPAKSGKAPRVVEPKEPEKIDYPVFDEASGGMRVPGPDDVVRHGRILKR